MHTVSTVMNEVKEAMAEYGAKDGTKVCEMKFKDHLGLLYEARVNIARELNLKEFN